MRLAPLSYSTSNLHLLLLGMAALLLVGLAIWILLKRRITPAERERRRRLAVLKTGRMGDAMLTDVQEDALYYTYSIHGVDYTASQDIATLRNLLPANLAVLIGPATLKYSSNNPANSILLGEGWSGLRAPQDTAARGNGLLAAKGTGPQP